MIYSKTYKCLFLQIPKTGSSSLGTLTTGNKWYGNNLKNKHATLSYFVNKRKITANEIEHVFGFVRNPWARLVSAFFYDLKTIDLKQPQTPWKYNLKELMKVNTTIEVKFEMYVRIMLDSHRLTTQLYRPQFEYFEPSIEQNHKLFDCCTVGRFESYQQDLDKMCNMINLPTIELPHINKTRHKHYTEYYNKETRKIVEDKYIEDIERYGYEFEG